MRQPTIAPCLGGYPAPRFNLACRGRPRRDSYCIPIGGGGIVFLLFCHRSGEMGEKTDVWQGTLALMVPKTLESMGPMHGYGLARRVEETRGQPVQWK